MAPPMSPDVERVFDGYPTKARRALLALRKLIFDTAAKTEGVGEIEETLRWGEPSYITAKSKSGTTIRIAWKAKQPERYAMYVHCQTNLVETFRGMFSDELEFDGQRAIVFEVGAPLPRAAVAVCVAEALTYHLRKRGTAGRGRRTAR